PGAARLLLSGGRRRHRHRGPHRDRRRRRRGRGLPTAAARDRPARAGTRRPGMSAFRVEVRVMPRAALLDPQGQAVEHALHALGFDVVVLPGGLSYGDYLRSGAIARCSRVMGAVTEHAHAGGAVLGICNGFQILCEAGLLPGGLMRNARLRFLSRPVWVRVEQTDTPFTSLYENGEVLEIPVAHGDGRYVVEPRTAAELEATERVVWRYVRDNPN